MILKVLQEEFGLTGAKIIPTYQVNPEDDRYKPLSKKSFVLGQFEEEQESRLDVGESVFSDLVGRDAVYFITHPYNNSVGGKCDTVIFQARLFGDLLNENAGVKQLTLVMPVFPYELNHSTRRKKKKKLFEGRSLRKILEDFSGDGYNELITIAPHSSTTEWITNDQNMCFRGINPFRAEVDVSSPRMGPFLYTNPEKTSKRVDYKQQIARLTPYITYLKETYGASIKDLLFVATDDGSELVIEPIVYACRGDKQNILAVHKDRDEASRIKLFGLKSISTARLEDISGRTCIIVDDKMLSLGTVNGVGQTLKEDHGAEEVVGLIAHDQTYKESSITSSYVDRFVVMETNPNSIAAHMTDSIVDRLPLETTALLLAAEIFDSYCNIREMGEIKVR